MGPPGLFGGVLGIRYVPAVKLPCHTAVSYTRWAHSHSACSNWLNPAPDTLLHCFPSRKPSKALDFAYRDAPPAPTSSWRESSFIRANRDPRIDQTMGIFSRSLHHVLYDHQVGKLLVSLIGSLLGLLIKFYWLVLNEPEDLARRNLTVPAILGTVLGRFPHFSHN